MSTDLHTQLDQAVRARLDLAKESVVDGSSWYSVWDLAGSQPVSAGLAEFDARFIAANDPTTVIRICEAHLDIVAMYTTAKAETRLPIARTEPKSRYRQIVAADHDSAMGRLVALGLVLERLAVAYGLLDPAGE